MYEYSYFDFILFHVDIENEKKNSDKKRNIRKMSNFIEFLPSVFTPPQ